MKKRVVDLFNAVRGNDAEKLAEVLNEDPSLLNVQFPPHNQTPLFVAVAYGHADCVDVMLEDQHAKQIDIGLVDAFGRTPLTAAMDLEMDDLRDRLLPIYAPDLIDPS